MVALSCQLTLRGIGRKKAAGAELEFTCRRCIVPLSSGVDPLIQQVAIALCEMLIQYAADTKDHTVSDTFVQLLRSRKTELNQTAA